MQHQSLQIQAYYRYIISMDSKFNADHFSLKDMGSRMSV